MRFAAEALGHQAEQRTLPFRINEQTKSIVDAAATLFESDSFADARYAIISLEALPSLARNTTSTVGKFFFWLFPLSPDMRYVYFQASFDVQRGSMKYQREHENRIKVHTYPWQISSCTCSA